MQNIIDKQERKIRAIESRITKTENLLYHTRTKDPVKIEYLQYQLQADQYQLQHEQTELAKLRKRLDKLPTLQRQVKNTAHHNLTKAEAARQHYAAKQQKRKQYYLNKLNNTSNA